MEELVKKIETITFNAGGIWSIVLEDLQNGQRWQMREEEKHYAASIIKIPIMATVYRLADEGKLKVSEMITIEKEDLVAGAGQLQHLTIQSLSITDLMTLMIIQSDNTATNLLIERVTVEAIQETMAIAQMENSSFYNKLMTVPVSVEGYNRITANDIAKLLKMIAYGQFSSRYACEQMVALMKKQQIHYMTQYLPSPYDNVVGMPAKWEFASKTGNITGVRHDVGLFYVGNRSLAVTILSSDCDKKIAMNALGEIGITLYEYLIRKGNGGVH